MLGRIKINDGETMKEMVNSKVRLAQPESACSQATSHIHPISCNIRGNSTIQLSTSSTLVTTPFFTQAWWTSALCNSTFPYAWC